MTEQKINEYANGEEVVAKLEPSKRTIKNDCVRGLMFTLFSLVLLAAFLAQFFTNGRVIDAQLTLLLFLTCFLFVGGILAFALTFFQLRGGLLLTKTRIVGYGGFPFMKKVEVMHRDNDGFYVYSAKRNVYFVRVGKFTVAYMDNPQEFEQSLYDVLEENFKDSTLKRPEARVFEAEPRTPKNK